MLEAKHEGEVDMRRSIRVIGMAMALSLLAVTASHPILGESTPSSSITGEYLLAFNICDGGSSSSNCVDPADFETFLVQSDDGVSWRPIVGFTPLPLDCPDPIRRGDTLYIFGQSMDGAPTPKVCKYHFDTDTWDPPIELRINNSRPPYEEFGEFGRERFVESSVILDEQGRIVIFYRLFYRAGHGMKDGDIEYIRSATEVVGSDGAEFTVDGSDRFTIDVHPGTREQINNVGNPDVFRGPDGYYLLLGFSGPHQDPLPEIQWGNMLLFSEDLRGAFSLVDKPQQGFIMTNTSGLQSAGHFDAKTGKYWIYGLVDAERYSYPGFGSVGRAVVAGLEQRIPDSKFRTVLNPLSVPGLVTIGASEPGFTVNESWPAALGEMPATVWREPGGSCEVHVVFRETLPRGTDKPEFVRYSVEVTGSSGDPIALRVLSDEREITEGISLSPMRDIPTFEASLDVYYKLLAPDSPLLWLEVRPSVSI